VNTRHEYRPVAQKHQRPSTAELRRLQRRHRVKRESLAVCWMPWVMTTFVPASSFHGSSYDLSNGATTSVAMSGENCRPLAIENVVSAPRCHPPPTDINSSFVARSPGGDCCVPGEWRMNYYLFRRIADNRWFAERPERTEITAQAARHTVDRSPGAIKCYTQIDQRSGEFRVALNLIAGNGLARRNFLGKPNLSPPRGPLQAGREPGLKFGMQISRFWLDNF